LVRACLHAASDHPPIVSRQHRVPVLLLVVVMPHQRRQAEASEEKDSTAG